MKVEEQQRRLVTDSQSSLEDIQSWIVSYLSKLLEISADEIEVNVPFDSYGLDSSAAIGLTGDLEDWLGKEVDPTVLYDYPTIDTLSEYLSGV
ncbi:MAG: acyl carrier protein [Phormidesmis sp.]